MMIEKIIKCALENEEKEDLFLSGVELFSLYDLGLVNIPMLEPPMIFKDHYQEFLTQDKDSLIEEITERIVLRIGKDKVTNWDERVYGAAVYCLDGSVIFAYTLSTDTVIKICKTEWGPDEGDSSFAFENDVESVSTFEMVSKLLAKTPLYALLVLQELPNPYGEETGYQDYRLFRTVHMTNTDTISESKIIQFPAGR